MSDLLSLQHVQKQKEQLKQTQKLMVSQQMQQALRLLQLPVLELSQAIEQEIARNPLLEYDEESDAVEDQEDEEADADPEKEIQFNEKDFEFLYKLDEELRDYFAESEPPFKDHHLNAQNKKHYLENLIQQKPSLFTHLMTQAKEWMTDENQTFILEILIGSLDENGYIGTSIKELSILYSIPLQELKKGLKILQHCEPWGIGAKNLQESLLIQLLHQRKGKSTAYKIIENHFDLFLKKRFNEIQKKLKCSAHEIEQAITKDIAHLDTHPGHLFSDSPPTPLVPDASLSFEQEKPIIEIHEERLPPLKLNPKYLRLLKQPSVSIETKSFIQQKIFSAHWLIRNIRQRNETLYRIIEVLAKKQLVYFTTPNGALVPMTMQSVADELNLHESTVARAVSNKYLYSAKGLLPLRSFFTNAYMLVNGEDISSKTVRDMLLEMIQKENKSRPYSDEKLSQLLQKNGIPCARRTVAKYRAMLQIGSSQQRKNRWSK